MNSGSEFGQLLSHVAFYRNRASVYKQFTIQCLQTSIHCCQALTPLVHPPQRVDWGPESFPTALCFSPDGRLWVVGGEAEVEEGQDLVSRALTLFMSPRAEAPPRVRVRVLGRRGGGEGRETGDGEKAGRDGEGGFEVVEGGGGSEGGDMLVFLQGS